MQASAGAKYHMHSHMSILAKQHMPSHKTASTWQNVKWHNGVGKETRNFHYMSPYQRLIISNIKEMIWMKVIIGCTGDAYL